MFTPSVYAHERTDSKLHQGTVVQIIVILTTSLRRQFVKYMPTTLANPLLFFVEKIMVDLKYFRFKF